MQEATANDKNKNSINRNFILKILVILIPHIFSQIKNLPLKNKFEKITLRWVVLSCSCLIHTSTNTNPHPSSQSAAEQLCWIIKRHLILFARKLRVGFRLRLRSNNPPSHNWLLDFLPYPESRFWFHQPLTWQNWLAIDFLYKWKVWLSFRRRINSLVPKQSHPRARSSAAGALSAEHNLD